MEPLQTGLHPSPLPPHGGGAAWARKPEGFRRPSRCQHADRAAAAEGDAARASLLQLVAAGGAMRCSSLPTRARRPRDLLSINRLSPLPAPCPPPLLHRPAACRR